jgi:hypothetical protein
MFEDLQAQLRDALEAILASSTPKKVVLAGPGLRWSVPDLGTNLGTKSFRGKFTDGQLAEKYGGQGRD